MEDLGIQNKWRVAVSRPMAICCLLVLATVAVYWRVTGFDFLNYDDPSYISENLHVQKGLSVQNIVWACKTTELSSWYPLTWISFMLDVSLFGRTAAGPHFVNVLLHAANTVLLFLLLRSLTGAQWRSALVAGLFAWHPLHVESVAWVSERKDVLSAFFSLLTIWLYVEYIRAESARAKSYRYALALIFFALALLAKPMQVTLPGLLLLLDFWPLKRIERRGFWTLIPEKTPFLILALADAGMTVAVHRDTEALVSLGQAPLAGRIQNALVSYPRYLGKTFWPLDLIVPYPYHGTWSATTTAVSVLFFCGLILLCVRFWRRWPFLAMGWFWFVVTLLPVIGLITWGSHSMADRFTYFPSIGMFIAIVWAAEAVCASVRTPTVIMGAAAAVILVACAGRSLDQLSYWRNSETLFRHSLAVDPENSVAYYALGSAQADAGRLDEAIGNYERALMISTNNPEMFHSLGKAWAKKGRNEEAIYFYQRAILLKPGFALAHCSLGNAWVEMKQLDRARDEFNESRRLDPEQPAAYCGLGNVAMDEGKSEEALADYQKALQIDAADPVAHCGIGNVLSQAGRLADSANEYQLALKSKPHFVEAENNLGTVLLRMGHADEAVQYFRATLADKPDHLGAYVNLGNALAGQGKMDEAAAEFTRAVSLDTNSLAAQFGLGVMSARLGRREEAVTHLTEALRIKPDFSGAQELLEKVSSYSEQ